MNCQANNYELQTSNYQLNIWTNVRIFMSCGLMVCGLSCPALAQEAKQTSVKKISPPSQQEEGRVSNNITTSTEVPPASSQETKPASLSGDASDATKATSDTNVSSASSNTETNTNGVVPTDPSMIPSPESAAADNPTNVPLPMDPNAGSSIEAASEQASPVNSTESIEKKKHEINIRYNEVRTQVEKEEALVALRQGADKATTTEGERQTLKAYYELLFKRMKQIDSSLTERCDVMQGAYLRRVEQTGVEPTIPLHLSSRADKNSTNVPQGISPVTKEKLHKKISTSNTSQ